MSLENKKSPENPLSGWPGLVGKDKQRWLFAIYNIAHICAVVKDATCVKDIS